MITDDAAEIKRPSVYFSALVGQHNDLPCGILPRAFLGRQHAAYVLALAAFLSATLFGGSARAQVEDTRASGAGAVSMAAFGVVADSDGTPGNGTDNTAAVRAAVAWSLATGREIDVPSALVHRYVRITAPVAIEGHVNIGGSGCAPYGSGPGIPTPGAGSWLYEDQTGVGFSAGATNGAAGYVLHDFCMIWNQPAPPKADAAFTASISGSRMTVSSLASGKIAIGQVLTDPGVAVLPGTLVVAMNGATTGGAGTYVVSRAQTVPTTTITSYPHWTPNPNDFAIVQNNDDGRLDNLFLLNPTNGIRINGGRAVIRNLRGQFLRRDLYVDGAQDVVRFEDGHDWPFWSQNAAIFNAMYADKEHIYTARADGIEILDDYVIAGRVCWHIGTNAVGDTTYSPVATGLSCDGFSQDGILVDGAPRNTTILALANYGFGGVGGGSTGCAIDIKNGGYVQGVNVNGSSSAGPMFCATGDNARMALFAPQAQAYDRAGLPGTPAFLAGAHGYLTLNGLVSILSPPPMPTLYSSTGFISKDGIDPRTDLLHARGVNGEDNIIEVRPRGHYIFTDVTAGAILITDVESGQTSLVIVASSGAITLVQAGMEFVKTLNPRFDQTGIGFAGVPSSVMLSNGFASTHRYSVMALATKR